MTPLEIIGVVLLSLLSLISLIALIEQISNIIKRRKVQQGIKNLLDKMFKNIDNDMKELKREEFFADLEKIKNENKKEEE